MSFFIGNDVANTKILHVTKNTRTITELKSGELSDTIFHSNLNYIRVTKVQGSILNSVLTVTQSVRDAIGTNGWIVVNSSGICIPAIWGRSLNPDTATYSPFYGKWSGLSLRLGRNATGPGPGPNNYQYDWIDLDSTNNGTCTIYVFSLDITNSVFSKIPTTNNEFLMGNGQLNIKGFNVLDSAYISTAEVNNVDDKINVFGKIFQITNTNIIGNSVSLISNPSYSAILRNNVPIIHSKLNTSMRYRGSKSIYLPGNPGRYANWNIVSASVDFDEPLPDNAFIVCSLNALNNFTSDNNCFLFHNSCGEVLFGRLAFNILTHWKVSAQVTTSQFILRSYFMVAGSYSILGNTYTIHIFY